jgi:starch phosphorylase
MKVLVNGGLNLSERDGWWAEAHSPEVGWAIGDGKEHGEDPAWDTAEADELYSVLERQVIPEFYERNESGMAAKWLGRIRESMAQLTPEFSASRAIREYTEDYYLPAASGYRDRAAREGALGNSLIQWQKRISQHWSSVRFGNVEVKTHDGQQVIRVQVFPGSVDPDELRVELYAEPDQVMTACKACANPGGALLYSAEVPAGRPVSDYTPRIIPHHPSASVPLEAPQILWQR